MKNKVTDLNNHLFAQLERLSDEELTESPEALEKEMQRTKAIVSVAEQIIESHKTTVQAMKIMQRGGVDIEFIGNKVLGTPIEIDQHENKT